MQDVKYTTEEAAAYLGVSPRTLETWRGTNMTPVYYKPTKALVYYFKSDLDNWIKAHPKGGEQ